MVLVMFNIDFVALFANSLKWLCLTSSLNLNTALQNPLSVVKNHSAIKDAVIAGIKNMEAMKTLSVLCLKRVIMLVRHLMRCML